MLRFFLPIFFSLTTLFSAAQNKGSFLELSPDTVKLGEIALNDLNQNHGKVQITVLNKGNQPLILNDVTGCCGTNIKEWPKAPILPGKLGIIKVEFRIETKPQVISRTVTIKSNSFNLKLVKVPIIGIVYIPKDKNEIAL